MSNNFAKHKNKQRKNSTMLTAKPGEYGLKQQTDMNRWMSVLPTEIPYRWLCLFVNKRCFYSMVLKLFVSSGFHFENSWDISYTELNIIAYPWYYMKYLNLPSKSVQVWSTFIPGQSSAVFLIFLFIKSKI